MIKSILPAALVLSASLSGAARANSPHDITYNFKSPGDSITNSPGLIAQEIPAVQEEGFVFDFLGCETRPNTDVPLTCEFIVENSQEQERSLQLYGNYGRSTYSRVIDTSGNEIIASFAQIGRASDNSSAVTTLPSDIPLKASLSFAEAPEGGIRILDLKMYTRGVGEFDVEFRLAR